MTASNKSVTIDTASPQAIKEILRTALHNKLSNEVQNQQWLGQLTTKQLKDPNISSSANNIFSTWKNIPDIVYSVNKNIRQQLLPTKAYQQSKVQAQVTDTKCRMCKDKDKVESTTHVLSMCSKIAQTLYTARHDRMLRPFYHFLLHKYRYEESDHDKPWHQQRQPQSVLENTNSKILWNVPFTLEKAPINGANRIDMAVWDKTTNEWTLLEGTVCNVGTIEEKRKHKQDKYTELRAGIKNMYKEVNSKVMQVNIVFDFLGGYHTTLEQELNTLTTDKKETLYLLKKAQKWVLSQNTEIVKFFYQYTT